MAVMLTKLSSKIIFRTNSILKQRQRCEELASARSTPSHDRHPADFLENDKRPPISGDLLLRLQYARLDAACWSYVGNLIPQKQKAQPLSGRWAQSILHPFSPLELGGACGVPTAASDVYRTKGTRRKG